MAATEPKGHGQHAGMWVFPDASAKPKRGTRSTYLKFKEKGSMDWALSAVAVSFRLSGGKVTDPRIVLGGVAPIPWVAAEAEDALRGKKLTTDVLEAAAAAAVQDAEPLTHNGYKVPLTRTLVKRAIDGLIRKEG